MLISPREVKEYRSYPNLNAVMKELGVFFKGTLYKPVLCPYCNQMSIIDEELSIGICSCCSSTFPIYVSDYFNIHKSWVKLSDLSVRLAEAEEEFLCN